MEVSLSSKTGLRFPNEGEMFAEESKIVFSIVVSDEGVSIYMLKFLLTRPKLLSVNDDESDDEGLIWMSGPESKIN